MAENIIYEKRAVLWELIMETATLKKNNVTLIVLGKALIRDSKSGEHNLSFRGREVLNKAVARYEELERKKAEVNMIMAGSHTNYAMVPTPEGLRPGRTQAEIMADEAISQGVHKNKVFKSERGTNVQLNLHFVRKYMEEHNILSDIEIFVDKHMYKRAEMVAKRIFSKGNGWEFEVKITPVHTPRSIGRAVYENVIYEPLETAYMWLAHQAGYVQHLITGKNQYGKK